MKDSTTKFKYDFNKQDWVLFENDLLNNDIKNFNEACKKANWNFVGFEN